jgi:leader peptidase (prepilin peptidase)/N-methyltransferase
MQPVTIGPALWITLVLAAGAGLAAGLLANFAADTLPRLTRPGAEAKLAGTAAGTAAGAGRGDDRSPPRARRQIVLAVLPPLFVLLALANPGDGARLVVSWCYTWFLTTVVVIDLETRRVLNVMLGPAALFALGAGLWLGTPSLPSMVMGGVVAFGLFWCLFLFGRMCFGRGALGFGDVKLVAVIGLMTGYPNVMQALLLGAVLGGAGALALVATRRAGWKTTCAYAPYLAAGAMLALWGSFGG